MSESLHDIAVHMSGGRCSKSCKGCPASDFNIHEGQPCLIERLADISNTDEQIEAMRRWAAEHPLPKKTWLDMFNATFPNAYKYNGRPRMCPEMLYGSAAENIDCSNKYYDGTCLDCWNREVDE